MDIRFRETGKHKIMEVDGDVDLYNVGELKTSLNQLIDEDGTHSLILDLSGVTYLDSSAIGALVSGQKKINSREGKFALLNVKENIMKIFMESGMDKFFTIYEDEKLIQ